MSYAIFINYMDGRRKPLLWRLYLTEAYKESDQITVKLDQQQGMGQIKFTIPEKDLESFIEGLRKAKES